MSTDASDVLARLREDIAREEAELNAIEDHLETKAAQLSFLHIEYTAQKARVLHRYEPRLAPLRAKLDAAAQTESLLRLRLQWMERVVVEQERRSESDMGFNFKRDMLAPAEEYAAAAHKNLQECYAHIAACPEAALRVVSNYMCPQEESIDTMVLVMKVRGEAPEEQTWEAAQVLLSYNYFHDFFETRSESLLQRCDLPEEVVLEELEEFCADPRHSVGNLYQMSTPIGCLGEWLRCVRDYYRVKCVTAPLLLKPDDDLQEKTRRAHRWLNARTLSKTQRTDAPAATAPSEEAGGDDESTMVDELTAQCMAEDLSAFDRTMLLAKLRAGLSPLNDIVAEVEADYHAVEQEMATALQEMDGNYDETMLPIEEQIEDATEAFSQCISRQAPGNDLMKLMPPPVEEGGDRAVRAVVATPAAAEESLDGRDEL